MIAFVVLFIAELKKPETAHLAEDRMKKKKTGIWNRKHCK